MCVRVCLPACRLPPPACRRPLAAACLLAAARLPPACLLAAARLPPPACRRMPACFRPLAACLLAAARLPACLPACPPARAQALEDRRVRQCKENEEAIVAPVAAAEAERGRKMDAVDEAYGTLPGFNAMSSRNRAKVVKAVAAMLAKQTSRLAGANREEGDDGS